VAARAFKPLRPNHLTTGRTSTSSFVSLMKASWEIAPPWKTMGLRLLPKLDKSITYMLHTFEAPLKPGP